MALYRRLRHARSHAWRRSGRRRARAGVPRMILLCGIPSESTLAMVARALDGLGVDYRVLNQRKVAALDIAWQIDGRGIAGTLRLEDETLRLTDIGAVYFRLMDDRILPELEGAPEGSPARRHARGFHDALVRWIEIAPGRIVTHSQPQGSN